MVLVKHELFHGSYGHDADVGAKKQQQHIFPFFYMDNLFIYVKSKRCKQMNLFHSIEERKKKNE